MRKPLLLGLCMLVFFLPAAFAGPSKERSIPLVTLYDYDCGILRGLYVTAQVLAVFDTNRSINVEGFLSHFEANRGRKDILLRDIDVVTKRFKNQALAAELKTVTAATFASFPVEGKGYVDYWNAQLSTQLRIFSAFVDQVQMIRDKACMGIDN